MSNTIDNTPLRTAHIAVVGVGGAGCKAVKHMILCGLEAVDFVAINTDVVELNLSLADYRIQVGRNLTHGMGAGGIASVGFQSIEEARREIATALRAKDIIFIVAGMGGGTGSGGTAAVAGIAKESGALVIGVVTKPFEFEGARRMLLALDGIDELRKHVDMLLVIPNQKLLQCMDRGMSVQGSFEFLDAFMYDAVRGISDTLTKAGIICVGFADIRMLFLDAGEARIGIGSGSGMNRADQAVHAALTHPLLDDVSIHEADSILVNITVDSSFEFLEAMAIGRSIESATGKQARVVMGILFHDALGDYLKMTIYAAGFRRKKKDGMLT